MRSILTIILTLAISLQAMSQIQLNLSVKEADTGEPLPNANVQVGTSVYSTDIEGNAIISTKKGVHAIKISFVGYETYSKSISLEGDEKLTVSLTPDVLLDDEVIVNATRAGAETPMTYTTLEKEKIQKQNFGQDLPFLLNFTPSLVTTSDAGAGIGYTGLRIRGSDATRINVTINGIPLNDSESQGVFWVDVPDIASSTNNIQIQRGVGTSTNGAGAFGGSINLQTNARNTKAYGEFINSLGSFNTRRHTIGFGTGLINDHWTLDGRVSKIGSDGYIDRAESDLDSYYFSGGYYGKKTMVKAIVFGGAERTYQSWYGTPQAVLENDQEGIEAVIANNGLNDAQADNMRNSGRTFNWYLYKDQVDDYKQDHYQIHISHEFMNNLVGSISGHYTYGRGFYEQFRYDDDFSDYSLEPVDVNGTLMESTDLVRRRWLDNDFYGVTYSLNYTTDDLNLIFGGAANRYDGDHFGEIIWAQYASNFNLGDRYYESNGIKDDFNSYIKANYNFTDNLSAFIDLQYRNISYTSDGIDNDLKTIDINQNFDFFNPKIGAFYQLDNEQSVYGSFAVANREPVRSDFIDSPLDPKAERLNNLEIGYRRVNSRMNVGANFYYMDYKDQLILTGEVNDVGASVRTNVPDSYRAGVEIEAGLKLSEQFTWSANLTLSENKIKKFNEVLYDYGPAFDEFNVIVNEYSDTDIAFSPSVIAGSQLSYFPVSNTEISLLTKYVGDQYLDNTSNEARKIDAYFVNDLRLSYTVLSEKFKALTFSLLVNNIFDELYASNGYTFGYSGGPDYVVRENYLYPQATRNFLASVSFKF